MVRTFSLQAAVEPAVDERAVEREAEQTREQFNEQLSGLSMDTEAGGIAGAGGGGAVGGVGGGGGPLQTGAAAGAASRISAGGLAGGAAKAALPVALAGATAFSISQGIQRLAQASPALAATSSQLQTALDVALQPLGQFLAKKADPLVDGIVDLAMGFNSVANSEGIAVGLGSITASAATSLADAIVGGDTGTVLDTLFPIQEVIKFNERFVEGLTGVDISAAVESFVGDIESSWPGWNGLVGSVNLGDFVTGINLGNFIDIPDILRDGDPGGETPTGETGNGDQEPSTDPTDGTDDGSDPPPGRFPPSFDSDPAFDATGEADRRADQVGGGGPVVGLDTGGSIRRGGMARLHDGERVLPEAQVSDRGEADLAGTDEITRLLRQIRRDLRRQTDSNSGRDDAIVDRLDRLLRKMDQGGSTTVSEDDVIAALAKLLDRGGGRDPLAR